MGIPGYFWSGQVCILPVLPVDIRRVHPHRNPGDDEDEEDGIAEQNYSNSNRFHSFHNCQSSTSGDNVI